MSSSRGLVFSESSELWPCGSIDRPCNAGLADALRSPTGIDDRRSASLNRGFTFIIIGIIGLLAGLSTASITTADEEAGGDADLATAVRQLQKWRSSFASIHVEWRSWYRSAYAQRFPEMDLDKELGVNYFTKYEFWWADWGAFRRNMTQIEGGRTMYRDAMASELTRPWSAETIAEGDQSDWSLIKLYVPDASKPLSANLTMNGIYGLWNSSGKWLPDRLAGGDVKVTLGELDGHRCIVVRLTAELRQETVWLDPEFDGLPRKVEVLGRAPDQDALRHYHSWSVSEFQRVDDRIWFPKRGNFIVLEEGLPGFEWIIDRVVLNESLPRSLFEPPKPGPTTKVFDYLGEKVYGGGAAETSSSPTATPPATIATGNTIATPGGFPWRWAAVAFASLLALGIAVRWLQRSRG